MPKWGMVIDTTRCIGCHGCRLACQNQNDLPPKEYFNRIDEKEFGIFPDFKRRFTAIQCQHCDNPPCVKVCPTGASYKRSDGLVMINNDDCIGCKYCIVACPYDARIINEKDGFAQKCGFCIKFVESGEQPACVTNCPMGVRIFGDLNDPLSEIVKVITSKKPVRLGEGLGTLPNIYYLLS